MYAILYYIDESFQSLVRILSTANAATQQQILQILQNLQGNDALYGKKLVESGSVESLAELLFSGQDSLIIPALKLVSQVTTNSL